MSMWTEVSAKSWGKGGKKSVPVCVVGVSSLVTGRDEMPSVPLLWGCRGIGETGTVAVCISAAWKRRAGLYISELYRAWSWISLPWGGMWGD